MSVGAVHGTCDCGKCNCTSNYTGEACGCSTLTKDCLDSKGVGSLYPSKQGLYIQSVPYWLT